MATTQQELVTINNTYLRTYPNPTNIDNAISLTEWTTADSGDPVANLLTTLLVGVRAKNSAGWNLELSAAQKKALYHEVSELFAQATTNIKAISDAITAAYTALP